MKRYIRTLAAMLVMAAVFAVAIIVTGCNGSVTPAQITNAVDTGLKLYTAISADTLLVATAQAQAMPPGPSRDKALAHVDQLRTEQQGQALIASLAAGTIDSFVMPPTTVPPAPVIVVPAK